MPEGTEKDSISDPAALARDSSERECPRQGSSAHGDAPGCGAGAAGDAAALAPLLTTGDLARLCETTVRTVRFYEEEGLIESTGRSEGGHRMFAPVQRQKLQLIMDLRAAGLSLHEIKTLFEIKSRARSAREAAQQMTEALEAQIECMQRKIAVLRRLRDDLASMVTVIRECRTCERPDFRECCAGCEVMNRPGLPRAVRLLWSSRE